MRSVISIAIALISGPLLAQCAATPIVDQPVMNAPTPAKDVGYFQMTFSSSLAPASIDTSNSQRSGHDWYVGQFFTKCATPQEAVAWREGVFELTGVTDSCNARGDTSIATAVLHDNRKDWIGTAFGGGAYIEAELSFDPQNTISAKQPAQWPAFWAMSVEHLAQLPEEQWAGEDYGYRHFSEVDIFEYDVWSFAGKYSYGGAVHDWFGKYKETCPIPHFCRVTNSAGGGTEFDNFVITTPRGTDFRQPHRFGVLWVPATTTRRGSLTYYFDGRPTNDAVSWTQYEGQKPPPGKASWTFGILDKQHLVLLLSTGVGQPMAVRNVRVWQKDSSQNWYGSQGTGPLSVVPIN